MSNKLKITRFSVLPDERRVLMGRDLAELFEAGYVYEAIDVLDTIVIRKLDKYALPSKGAYPNENSDNNRIMYSGLHLITLKEQDLAQSEIEEYKV